MNPGAQQREVTYKPSFLDGVLALEEYAARTSRQQGRKLTADLFEFIVSVIEPNPFAFPEYAGRPTPAHEYRRAVFRKEFLLYYRVTDEELKFLQVHHASRNPGSLRLEE